MELHSEHPPCIALLTKLSAQIVFLLARSLNLLSSLSSHPLFSLLTTTALLTFLYIPRLLLPLLFSPVLISSVVLLATVLRISASPPQEPASQPPSSGDPAVLPPEHNSKSNSEMTRFHQKGILREQSIEWIRRGGPLEVIYEEYEEDEDGGHGGYGKVEDVEPWSSDSEMESVGNPTVAEECDLSPGNPCFRWDEEEEEDGLIEIALEEDNLIEIDISRCR